MVGGGGKNSVTFKVVRGGGVVGSSNKNYSDIRKNNIVPGQSVESSTSSYSRWIHNSLLPRKVPLFQNLPFFTREVDITRNDMVEECLLDNKSILFINRYDC